MSVSKNEASFLQHNDWGHLPNTILAVIFKYLPMPDKINASTTCKHWRDTLFYAKFWETFVFQLTSLDELSKRKVEFQDAAFAKKIKNAHVYFNSLDLESLSYTDDVLDSLSKNRILEKLWLYPSHCRLYPVEEIITPLLPENHLYNRLCKIVTNCPKIETLSVGCLEEITLRSNDLLTLLWKSSFNEIRVLGLASLKYDPELYEATKINPIHFTRFTNLEILSIDYECICDELLDSLCSCSKLRRLIIHVHGIKNFHPGTTNEAWLRLKTSCPRYELRINLIHAYNVIHNFEQVIFKPAMPLTHLRVFFCETLNFAAMDVLHTYRSTLRSLWWVDSYNNPNRTMLLQRNNGEPLALDNMINPFILAVWRCTRLEEIVFLGYSVYVHDIVAIARLRSNTLKSLQLAKSNIVYTGNFRNERMLEQEVSESLGVPWSTISDHDMHKVVLNSTLGDSDEYVLSMLRNDLRD